MKDNFAREINYMRISITDRCNLRCRYCMPAKGIDKIEHDKILSFGNIERVARESAKLGITKFRITGGEPLVRRGVVDLVENLSKIKGVQELAMTTNGIFLSEYAEPLRKAGLQNINISLDTMNPDKYNEITRGGDLNKVLDGIIASLQTGFDPVKLNIVTMNGYNTDEILDFAKLTYSLPVDIRFIELMPVGYTLKDHNYKYISANEIKKKIPGLIYIEKQNSVAEYYRYPGAKGSIGFISPISSQFCSRCNKIRLTSDGKLKPCLLTNQEFDINEILKLNDNGKLRLAIKNAILSKVEKHQLNNVMKPVDREMNQIGG